MICAVHAQTADLHRVVHDDPRGVLSENDADETPATQRRRGRPLITAMQSCSHGMRMPWAVGGVGNAGAL